MADLRFSPEEAEEYYFKVLDRELGVALSGRILRTTEGWAAGLQLTGLMLEGLEGDQAAEAIGWFGGTNRYIIDYLVEEVLRKQPEDLCAFLCRTSVLERMNAGLCRAVTGLADRAALLSHLQRANLFVSALDPAGEWYRYHPQDEALHSKPSQPVLLRAELRVGLDSRVRPDPLGRGGGRLRADPPVRPGGASVRHLAQPLGADHRAGHRQRAAFGRVPEEARPGARRAGRAGHRRANHPHSNFAIRPYAPADRGGPRLTAVLQRRGIRLVKYLCSFFSHTSDTGSDTSPPFHPETVAIVKSACARRTVQGRDCP